MATRRLGRAGARDLARSASLSAAVATLAASPYGREVHVGMPRVEVERAIEQVTLWHLRVLAGWLPAAGTDVARAMAGYWEIANTRRHLSQLRGGGAVPEAFSLGSLATAWGRIARAGSAAEVRAALAASPWRDPGTDDVAGMLLAMRLAWGQQVAGSVPEAEPWAAGWTALLVARDLFIGDQAVRRIGRAHTRTLGSGSIHAGSLAQLRERLPRAAAWVLDGVTSPRDLWRADARWWARIEVDAAAMLRDPRPGPSVVAGAMALLGVDAWRTKAALEIASGAGAGIEAFDAIA
jgi:hypothetical protein